KFLSLSCKTFIKHVCGFHSKKKKIKLFSYNVITVCQNGEKCDCKTLQNLQDASDDLMLFDDSSLFIPYQIGDVFINHSQDETQEMLESAKETLEQEVQDLEKQVSAIQQVLGDLKVQLYAKFGNNINLEADES
uniref:Prefoldin subunit 4 n=1 Tax=Amphilophus citrinellus TaxID=61819 RepID=A0A3Q0SBA8_AMPCI